MTTALALAAVSSEPFRKVGLGWVWDHPEFPIRISADGVRESGGEVSVEILVEDTRYDPPRYMTLHRTNLMAINTRERLATSLANRCKNDDDLRRVPWADVIEQFSMGVIRRYREGEPTIAARDLRLVQRRPDLIQRILPACKPTIWYGPQGAGKGWLCIQAAVRVAYGIPFPGLRVGGPAPVLYLDWEDNEETFAERLNVVMAGLDRAVSGSPQVHYRKMRGQLPRQIPRVLADVQKLGIELVVIDSVGLAMGAKAESGNYEDQAIAFYEAMRYLEPAAVLLVDHVTGESATNGKLAGKAFGSIYKMAEARAAWEIRKEQDADSAEQIVGMYHFKHNHTKKYPALGFKLEFEADEDEMLMAVGISAHDLGDTAELSQQLTQPERIYAHLKINGACSQGEIAEHCCDGKDETARAQLNRMRRNGKVIRLEDGRWGLPYDRPVALPND